MYLKTFDEMKKTSVFFLLKPVNAIYGFLISVFISFAALFIWAIFSPMDDVVKGTVLLRPSEAVSSVKCVTSGQVFSKKFNNDDIVKEGDLLFTLDTSVYEKELETYRKELKKNEDDILINSLLLETMEKEIVPEEEEKKDLLVKSKVYITELKRYETVLEDLQTKLNREKNQPEALKIPQNITDAENLLSQNVLVFESWKSSQKMQAMETTKNLLSTKNTLESRISELERTIKNSTITAPISGRISEVTKLNTGDYLLTGEEVLKIIPQNAEKLKAEIYIDAGNVAKVKIGNPLKIKFPGLPPSRYGMVETEITLVPPDAVYENWNAVFSAEAGI